MKNNSKNGQLSAVDKFYRYEGGRCIQSTYLCFLHEWYRRAILGWGLEY